MKNIYKTIYRGVAVGAVTLSCVTMGQNVANEPAARANNHAEEGAKEAEVAVDYTKLSNDALIELLGSEVYLERENAYLEIWRRGRKVTSWLEKAIKSEDPERSLRAATVLRNVRIGVKPDTPKDIVELIKRFPKALLDEKEDILQELAIGKNYSYMLFLMADMKDREGAARLYKRFSSLGIRSAQQALAQGHTEGALELLKLVPQTDKILHARAFIMARTGKLKREIALLKGRRLSTEEKRWQLVMYQELGDRKLMYEYAKETQNQRLMMALDLLAGDASSSLAYYKSIAINGNATAGIKMLESLYGGAGESTMNKLRKRFQAQFDNGSSRLSEWVATVYLYYLIGDDEGADDVCRGLIPYEAFDLFSAADRPGEALAAIGITDEASYEKWKNAIRKELKEYDPRRRRMKVGIDQMLSPTDKLYKLVVFYYYNGELKKAKELARIAIDHQRNKKDGRWQNEIARLLKEGQHGICMEICLDLKKEKDLQEMVSVLYHDTDYVRTIWDALSARKATDIKQNFKDLGILMGMYIGVTKEIKGLQEYLLKQAKKDGAESHRTMLEALDLVAQRRQDSLEAAKLTDSLISLEKNKVKLDSYYKDSLSFAMRNLRWQRVIDIIDNHFSKITNYKLLTLKSIAERKLGHDKAADALLNRACLLTAGDEYQLLDILDWHSRVECRKQVAELYERELVIHSSEEESPEFMVAQSRLSSNDSYYMTSKQWDKVAAMKVAEGCEMLSLIFGQQPDSIFPASLDKNMVRQLKLIFFNLSFARGMEFYEKKQLSKAKRLLAGAHKAMRGNGIIADNFYPALRHTTFRKEYEQWVDASYQYLLKAIKAYPKGANTRNTLAWILSRAARKLDKCLLHAQKAVDLSHGEAAYLDTLAETWFAKKDRKKAVFWSKKAVDVSRSGTFFGGNDIFRRSVSLQEQLERFKTQPFSSY